MMNEHFELGDDDIRRALLGLKNLEPDEDLEISAFSGRGPDDSLELRLRVAEDELMDEYLDGELSAEESERFRREFLCTRDRRQRLLFAESLREVVEAIEGPVRSIASGSPRNVANRRDRRVWWTPSLKTFAQAAVVTIAVGAAAWFLLGRLDLDPGINEMTAGRSAPPRPTHSIATGARPVEGLPPVATVLLEPGLLRGPGDVERIVVPDGTSVIQLRLDLGVDEFESYNAALLDEAGVEIWARTGLDADEVEGRLLVSVTVPADLLSHGDYSLRLSGVRTDGHTEPVGRYHFRALRP